MAASSASSSTCTSWKTQAWRPLIIGLNADATSCFYCGESSPSIECTNCPAVFCNGVCQEQAESSHKYVCSEGSLKALVENLVDVKTLGISIALACMTMDIVERTLEKAKELKDPQVGGFSDLYDAVRASSVMCNTSDQLKIADTSMETCGRLFIKDHESGNLAIGGIVRANKDDAIFSERSLLFFSLLPFLFNQERQCISGEMMSMHIAMYQLLFAEAGASASQLVGISPSKHNDNDGDKDYTTVRIDTTFNAKELLDPKKLACCVHFFNIEAATSSKIKLFPSHTLALFEFKGTYCLVQAYEDTYTYAQWCTWDEDLKLLESPYNSERFVLSATPKYRKPSLPYKKVSNFLSDLTLLTLQGHHRETYEKITGIRLSKDKRPSAFTITCARFDFLCTTML